MNTPNLIRDVRKLIDLALGKPQRGITTGVSSDKIEKRKTCAICPSVKERKTQYKCTYLPQMSAIFQFAWSVVVKFVKVTPLTVHKKIRMPVLHYSVDVKVLCFD